ncbi:MAG: hypothetical protein K0S74_199 [Chlamydiales bacterium]|jgi:hypothetical protein|nr:hypothetical protein [Chlamydiales bacterium]
MSSSDDNQSYLEDDSFIPVPKIAFALLSGWPLIVYIQLLNEFYNTDEEYLDMSLDDIAVLCDTEVEDVEAAIQEILTESFPELNGKSFLEIEEVAFDNSSSDESEEEEQEPLYRIQLVDITEEANAYSGISGDLTD